MCSHSDNSFGKLKAQIIGEERTKAEALLCQIVLDGIIALEEGNNQIMDIKTIFGTDEKL